MVVARADEVEVARRVVVVREADREEEEMACRSSRGASGEAIGLASAGRMQARVRKKRIAKLGCDT